jgi:hypothetical protein
MTIALQGGMLIPSGLSVCCAVIPGRRSRVISLFVSLLMFAAMLDLSRPSSALAPVLWAALLVGATLAISIAGAALSRRRASGIDSRMTVHQGLGLLVMAALAVARAGGGVSAASHVDGMGMSATPLAGPLLVVAVAYAAYSVWVLRVAPSGRRRWLSRVDVGAMGASTLAMALMVTL